MKYLLYLFTLISSAITLNVQGFTFNAITDFVADEPQYQAGFTLTDNANTITAVGTDAIGNSFSLWFDTAVDMSALDSSNLMFFDFTANSGHSANSSFSISLFDSSFASSYDLSGYNFSDTTIIGSGVNNGVDLTNIKGLTVTTGGLLGTTVDIDISSIGIPEPSTYALIFGGLALGFVVLRRK